MSLFSHRSASALTLLAVSLLVIPRAVGAQCASGSSVFGQPLHFPTSGQNAYFFASGDFNADGIRDIAVTNGDHFHDGIGCRVNVFIGQGNRNYASAVPYTVGRNAHGLVAADLNEDGILDLASANTWSDHVSVLIGNGGGGHGDGTFASAVHYPVAGSPFDLVTADLDGDGILDLATCLNAANGVAVLRGQGSGGVGNGTFASPVVYGTNSIGTGLEAGDLDNDGDVDLVETEYHPGTIAVLLNSGAPLGPGSMAVSHFPAGPQPFGAAISDVNEDGNLDVLVANTANGGTAVLLGNGTGQYPARSMLASGNVGSVAVGDFDEDGILDLTAAVNHGNGTGYVVFHRGQGAGGVGNGTFAPAVAYSTGYDAYQQLVGDFDADGNLDLFVSYNNASGSLAQDPITLLPGTCGPPPPDQRYPVLTDVRDVPNDQGGKVFVTWTASSFDAPGGPVNQYRVWRRIPPAAAFAVAQPEGMPGLRTTTLISRPDGTTDIVYWEALATLPAQRLPGYGYTAATTQDSMRHDNPYTAFFVTALTSNIDEFYSSNVDSGYSVDNIKPHQPENVSGQLTASGLALDWDDNTDPDLAGYRVYRGASADFVPSESNRIALTTTPGFVDAGASGAEFYKLSAIDEAQNESEFTVLEPQAVAGVGPGRRVGFALHGVRPNPALGDRWTVDLSLAPGLPALLELIDASGRRVATRQLDATPGQRLVGFDLASKLTAGVYVVRLTQGARRTEIKAAILR